MFLDRIDPATLRTVGKLSAASGVGLILYNELGRGAPGDVQRLLLPALLVGGGILLAETPSKTSQHAVSGAQEDADRATWQTEERRARMLPWIVGGAALLVGTLYLVNR